jgi:hypothetical protein
MPGKILFAVILAIQISVSPSFATETMVQCQMVDDLCFIQGGFGNLNNLSLVLDTGSSWSVLAPSKVSELGVPPSMSVPVDGSGSGESSVAYVFNNIGITVSSMSLENQTIVSLPIDYIANGTNHPTDGILGANVFNNYAVTYDYFHQQVTFADTVPARFTEKSDVIPLRLDSNLPFIEAKISLPDGTQIEGAFFVDSGLVGTDVIINEPFRNAHPELLQYAPVSQKTISAVGGALVVDITQAPQIQIGSLSIKKPSAMYPIHPLGMYARSDLIGSIGAGILKQFTVSFDYRNSKAYLLPNPSFGKASP